MIRMHAYPRSARRSVLATAIACCFAPCLAFANPVGPAVSHGQASFSTQGKLLTVTNSPGSIINWQGFSVAAGETTRFVQQNALSAVLNRVVGANPSSILGALQSNGRVFLINPHGIVFGAGAQINTAGLVASTLNMMDADFLAGRLRFGHTPGAGAVSNAGEIRTPAGGRVLLISPEGVENSGIIHAPKGEVILAAGKSVELADSANPEVRVEVSAPDTRAVNLGKIVAESGKIGIYGGIVSNRGVVTADSAVVGENGKIVFRASRDASLDAGSVTSASGASGGSIEVSSGTGATLVAGSVTATGSEAAGGEVRVLGERVGVVGSGSIDASGERGGGTVLVGGDLQGANPGVRNAQVTYVGPETSIKADAGQSGSGGKVIVWADDSTRSYGNISARGGRQSGDGGFVETSGKRALDVQRGPDLRAPNGKGGTWLLDPNDYEIVAGGEFDPALNSGAPFFAPLADSSRIGVQLINTQLDFGSNVLITTASRGATDGTQAGNITISAPILKSAATSQGGPFIGTTSLTLQAHNNIVIAPGGSITSVGDPLNVILTANSDASGGGGITQGGAIMTNGGSVSMTAADSIAVNAAINTLNSQGTSGGSVQLVSTVGSVNVAGVVNGGFFSASGQGGVTIGAPVVSTSSFQATSNGALVTIASSVNAAGSVTLTGRTGVTTTTGSTIATGAFGTFAATVTDPGAAGSLNIDDGSSISARGATLTADNMEIQGSLSAGTGNVTIRQNQAGRAVDLGTNTAGKLSLTQAEFDRIAATGTFTIGNFNTGAITVSSPMSARTASAVSVITNSTFTSNPGASITSTVPLSLSATGAIDFGAPINGSVFDVSSGASITQNAAAPIAASGILNATAPMIALGASVGASQVNLTTDALTVASTVTAGSDINVRTYGFVPVNLGVNAHAAGSLDLTAAEVNNLRTTGNAGTLRIGSTSNDTLTIQGPLAPTGIQTLVLGSGNGVAQIAAATITVPKLALNVFGNVNLPEANAVGTLAASLCCAGDSFVFANAAAAPLTIGTIATADEIWGQNGISGIYNFDSDATTTAMVMANNLTIATPVSLFGGTVTIKPVSQAVNANLGGADLAGTTLGLDATELANVGAAKLIVRADKIDISSVVAPGSTALALVPFSPGRSLEVVAAKTPANNILELTPGDIGNVSVNTLVLGDATTGPLAVKTATTLAAGIGNIILQSGDQSSGITISDTLTTTAGSATNISLLGDAMTLNGDVRSVDGNVLVSTSTANRQIELGTRTAGKLALSQTEIQTWLHADTGTVVFGDANAGDIGVTTSLTLGSGVSMVSGGTITVPVSQVVSADRDLALTAPALNVAGVLTTVAGDVYLTADSITLDTSSSVASPSGDINVARRTMGDIALGTKPGGSLGLSTDELDRFQPADATGILRIGNMTTTRNITVTAPIAPEETSTLSLITAAGSVSQGAGATITSANLAVQASTGITLAQNNDIDTVAATTDSGNISLTYSGSNPLIVGAVDGLAGVSTTGPSGGDITLTSDELDLAASVSARAGQRNVTIVPLSNGQSLDIGSKPGGVLGLNAAEFNLIAASTLFLGNASTGNVTVTAPVSMTGGVNNVSLMTSSIGTTAINAAFTVPGSISVSTRTLNSAAPVTATSGAFTASADSMTFTAPVTAGSGSINLAPASIGTLVAVGGLDNVSTVWTLGLDATDLANLSYGAGVLTLGNSSAGDMTVTYAGTALPGSVALITGAQAIFSSSNFSVANNLNITANTMSIPGAGISAGTGINIAPTTSGRSITLGTKPATGLELDAAELAKISISGSGALAFDTSGTLTTSAALAFTLVPDISLSAGSLVHTGGALSAPGNIVLRGDSMNIGSSVASTNGGRITVTPRGFRSMNLGTNPAGSALGLTAAQMAMFSTTGVVQFGDTSTTSSISISQPVTQPAGSSALALVSNGAISQSAGGTITASNLRLQSFSSVNLSEGNNVGTLAGSSSGSFSFFNASPLIIGAVDNQQGISDSTVTLRADQLTISNIISGGSVTLAPRTAGNSITLGTKPAGAFGLTDAEIDLVSASTLTIGTAGTNPSGSITVSSALDRSFGNLNLVTAPGNTISVNAPLGSATTSNVSLNAGAGGTAVIAAPVTASSNVSVTADTIAISQPITSQFSSVSLANVGMTGLINIAGAINALSSINVTGRTIQVNAPLTASSAFSSVSLQAAAGTSGSSVTVNQQVTSGNSINITTDNIAINAPLVTTGSSVSLAPRSSGIPISIGLETPGAFSLSTSELALITTDQLSIGSSNSGELVVNAPIGPFTYDSLILRSGGDVTQTPGSTITLRNVDPDDSDIVTGSLSVFAGGMINLPEANDVASSVSGAASGTENNFVFNNITPLKLQNVSGVFASGKVLVTTPTTGTETPGGVSGSSGGQDDLLDAGLVGILKAQDTQKDADERADERKAEGEQKDKEEEKKRGTQSCS